MQQLKEQHPEDPDAASYSLPITAENLAVAKRALERHVEPAMWKRHDSPNYLNVEMIDPARKGMGLAYVPKVRQMLTQKQEEQLSGETGSGNRWVLDPTRVRGLPMSEDEKRQLRREGLPGEPPLPGEPGTQESKDKKDRKKLALPGYERFGDVINYVIRKIYDPHRSPADALLDLVGSIYAKVMTEGSDTERENYNAQLIEKARGENKALFSKPLNLKSYKEDPSEPLSQGQRFAHAWNQVRDDVIEFVSDDKNYKRMLADLGMENGHKAAELKNAITHTASIMIPCVLKGA
jgi:hypothetical protein